MSNEKQGAGFQEVARVFGRMCQSRVGCVGCPLREVYGDCTRWVLDNSEKAEEVIMSWHLAHPEPRYPTFREWIAPIQRFENKDTDTIMWSGSSWYLSLSWVNAHYSTPHEDKYYALDDIIPEHIAKLLGVEKSVPGRGGE